MFRVRYSLVALATLATMLHMVPAAAEIRLSALRVPEGFAVDVAAEGLASARQLAIGPRGTLFVGSLRAGQVYALRDEDGDGRFEKRWILARGLTMPSGVAVSGADLYVAALDTIWRLPNIEDHLSSPRRELVTGDLPRARHHGWKHIAFGPDSFLYVPVGAPCNVCLREDSEPRFASLLRMDPKTGIATIYARGIRNTLGFDWHPRSGELWFTDNGRDLLGDDVPPDEINVITRPGQHFGFPFRHARDLADPQFGNALGARQPVAPRVLIQAHSAPLGIAFYTGTQFPGQYHGALFVAEHGSWNRSSKVGYQVSVAFPDERGQVTAYRPFLSGFLQGQQAWGRPNDVLVMADGSLLVSDDEAGAVYRVTYGR